MKKNILYVLLLLLGIQQLHAQKIKLLAISKTNGYRHGAIPAGKAALALMAQQNNWQITFTEDSAQFSNYKTLKQYNAIIFLFVTGKVFGTGEEVVVQKFVENGGGLLTIHTGTDAEYEWGWYNNAIGAKFKKDLSKFNFLLEFGFFFSA